MQEAQHKSIDVIPEKPELRVHTANKAPMSMASNQDLLVQDQVLSDHHVKKVKTRSKRPKSSKIQARSK